MKSVAAEVVEFVWSPCLKESLEYHLRDVLNDSAGHSAMKDRPTSEKKASEISSEVKDRGPNSDNSISIPDVPALTGAQDTRAVCHRLV